MAGASDTLELELWNSVFLGTTPPSLPAAGANYYLALYTADPLATESAGATTSETSYPGYARQAIPRSSGGFTIAQASGVTTARNASTITFPASTGASGSITHAALVSSASGAGTIFLSAPLSSAVAIANGTQPQFAAGSLSFVID